MRVEANFTVEPHHPNLPAAEGWNWSFDGQGLILEEGGTWRMTYAAEEGEPRQVFPRADSIEWAVLGGWGIIQMGRDFEALSLQGLF